MADYTGYSTEPVSYPTYSNSLLFYYKSGWGYNYGYFYGGYIFAIIGASIWEITAIDGTGSHNSNLPVNMNADNHTGFINPTLIDVFYNRLLVEPSDIDFGVVVSSQAQEILVWNAYLETTVKLENIVETSLTGLSVSGSLPPPDVSFFPLQERTYILTATDQGPPEISGNIEFDWEIPYDSNIVTVIGRRLVAFPYLYKPNMVETLEWLTKIMPVNNGEETRSRIRTAPRQRFTVSAFVGTNEHSRADNMLYGWRSQIWAIPVWGETRIVTNPVVAGVFTIDVDTLYGDFRAGSLAMVYENERTYDLFRIFSMTTTSLTLDRGISDNFSASAAVVPVREGRMKQEPKRISTGYNAILSVIFDIDDNIELSSSASSDLYLDEDTYLNVPLKPGGRNFNDLYKKDIQTIDYKTGAVTQLSFWNYTKPSREFLVVLEGLQEIWEFRTWLHRRAGQQRPFYMPTFENNIRAVGSGNIGTSFNATDDANAILASDRDHIYFQMKDGTYYFRRVTDIFNSPGDEVLVTIDTSITEDLTDIDFISYMGLKRLASDRIQFKWQANDVVECKIPILEIDP